MKIDEKVLEFGQKHLEAVLLLDAIAGGSGFYGHPTTRVLADCFALGEAYLLEHSEMYVHPTLKTIREKADNGQDTLDLRVELAKNNNPISVTKELKLLAAQIKNSYQRKVRFEQADSLNVITLLLMDELGLEKSDIGYREAQVRVTGIDPPLIPSREYIEQYRRRILSLMGFRKDVPLNEAATQWRKSFGLLDPESVGKTYEKAATLMLEILKKNGLSSEAGLKIYTLKEARFLGFFGYGNKEGDFYGETCMVESSTKSIFDIIETATHEIGGHYFLHALWHEYAKRTQDLYAAIGVVSTSQSVINEGFANCVSSVFGNDLGHLFENIGFGIEKMSQAERQRNFAISNGLEVLAMISLGYEIARYYHFKDTDKAQMEKEFVEFGVDADRARNRAKHIVDSKTKVRPYCYSGPAYFPGMYVISRFMEHHTKDDMIRELCTNEGPTSLSVINLKI